MVDAGLQPKPLGRQTVKRSRSHKLTTRTKASLANRLTFSGLQELSFCAAFNASLASNRQRQYGIAHLTPADVRTDSCALKAWLRACGAGKVVVHFDLDVLDPAEIVAAVGVVPDGMRMNEVVRVINDIADEKEIVGLTVAEPMPRTALRIREMLSRLPLLKAQ